MLSYQICPHTGYQCPEQIMLYLTGTATLSVTLLYCKNKKEYSTDISVKYCILAQVFPGSPVLLCDCDS